MSQETRELSKDELEKAKAEIAKFSGILKGKPVKELTKEEADAMVEKYWKKRGFKL